MIVYNGTVIMRVTPERRNKILHIISKNQKTYILPKNNRDMVVGTLNLLTSFAELYPDIVEEYGIDIMKIREVKEDIIKMMGIPPTHYFKAYYYQTKHKGIKGNNKFSTLLIKFLIETANIPHTIKHAKMKIYFNPTNLPNIEITDTASRYVFEETYNMLSDNNPINGNIFYPRTEFVRVHYDDADVFECRTLYINTRDGFYFEKNRKYFDLLIEVIGKDNYEWFLKD